MSRLPQILLFDLGGVLIDLNWVSSARRLFGAEESESDLKKRWINLGSVREYESGRADFNRFYKLFVAETGTKISAADFRCEFAGIIGPEKPGCAEMLQDMAASFRLAMLSNTNPVHVEMLRKSTDLFGFFHDLFFSYELGMAKPDSEIFHEVCRKLACQAEQVIFFDDSQSNVDAAATCGMKSFRVDGPPDIIEILHRL